jgi:ATP-dependent helicase/nuclease subunit B
VVAPDAVEGHWALNRPLTAGKLEDYAACPYRFLLANVLRLEHLREPETTVRLDALNRGSLIHAVLERFMRERVPLTDRATELARLNAIAEEELAAAQARGETGYPLLWRIDRAAILDDLERWLDQERADVQPFDRHEYEVRFGKPYGSGEPVGPLTSDEPLRLDLGEGLVLELNGRIDRIDWRERDKRFRVIDYKTGSKWGNDGRLAGGEFLQLPLYLHAAARALDVEPTGGDAEYFYATRKGTFARVGFTGDDLEEREVDLFDLLRGMTGGIHGGDFHAEPEARRCEYCAFDSVCDPRRQRIRRRKSGDPRAVAADARREVK